MAIREFPVSWLGVYRASSNRYVNTSGDYIHAGGTYRDNTYIGIPSAVKDSIKSSKVAPRLSFKMNVTNAGEFDFGAHRETYNKAGGTMPWYVYTGLHPIYSDGWNTTDLTDVFMSGYLNGNYHGIVLYGGSNKAEAYGMTGNSNQAVFVVEGEWNTAPSEPASILNPKSSTIADGGVIIDWKAGSDAESSASELSYRLGYYDGSDWIEYWTVGAGVTSYNYPLSDKPETSRARFAVKTVDPQGLESGWKYSPYFTVNHNRPPNKPTNLTPAGGKILDRDRLQRFTWKHNDDGVQAGYRIAWRTVASNGTKGAWNYVPSSSGWVNSTSQYYDFAPSTFPLGEVEWFVVTKDQQGEGSPASSYERFYAGEASDAPIWLSPQSGAVLNSSEVIADWSSLDQIEYEIELLDSARALLWREQEIASNKSTLVGYSLENAQTYYLRIRVVNANSGLWSAWSEITITTQFVPPAQPTITLETLNEDGSSMDTITVSWNTDEVPTATLTDYVQVYRRKYNAIVAQEWVLIGDNLAPDSSMIDYSPASEQTYEYKIRAWGENDTYTDSAIAEGEIQLSHSFLQRAQSPSDLLVLDVEEREQNFDFGGEMMVFANRVKPVFEHGINELMDLPISFYIDSVSDLRSTIEFIKRRETFLYRDNAGRKFYCTLQNLSIKDLAVNGFEVGLTLSEVDYDEIVRGG